ncbi:MAG: restriction endonuclease [Cyanobacteria bacterium 13_1_40CM_2_61_4]|nr:MAG: restriction endonuclease [Cyanobacteria bacterium 13_1_40CM_2_61_4]
MVKRIPKGPKFVSYFWPIIEVLKMLGGSARPAEVREQLVRTLNISEDAQADTLPSGLPRFDNQVAWARFYLSKAGIIDSSARGVWTLTEKGRALEQLNHQEAVELCYAIHKQFHADRDPEPIAVTEESEMVAPQVAGTIGNENYQEQLIGLLRNLPPSGFERFCQRLLRESGFQEVTVTGRSGDGGIDGLGILQVTPLVTFKVLFQCKRYAGAVTPSQVRDFRGAMQGRADKGIIITTGSFTSDSKREAVRDGVPPIELVDGDKLVTMVEQLELGLNPIKSFKVDQAFFDEFKS